MYKTLNELKSITEEKWNKLIETEFVGWKRTKSSDELLELFLSSLEEAYKLGEKNTKERIEVLIPENDEAMGTSFWDGAERFRGKIVKLLQELNINK